MIRQFANNWRYWAKIVLLALIIALAFWAGEAVQSNDFAQDIIRRLGYSGVFIIAVVSGFNLIVPVPAVSFLPVFLAAGLSIFTSVLVLAAGMTLADFLAYLIGKTSRHMVLSSVERQVAETFNKVQNKLHWSPTLILFLFASFAPFPNEVLVIPMSFFGYRMWQVMLPVFGGNLIFAVVYSIGVMNILKFF